MSHNRPLAGLEEMMAHFKAIMQTDALRTDSGDSLVKLARGKDRFLFRLDKTIDWQEFTPSSLKPTKARLLVAGLRQGYRMMPCSPFKMLLGHFLKTSERAIEERCHWLIRGQLFVKLGLCVAVPDYSTLTLFKRWLRKDHGIGDLKAILEGIIREGSAQGVKSRFIQIVDAGHMVANADGGPLK